MSSNSSGDWCNVLLKNQQNDMATKIVDDWMSSHPEVNPLLATKILQALDRQFIRLRG